MFSSHVEVLKNRSLHRALNDTAILRFEGGAHIAVHKSILKRLPGYTAPGARRVVLTGVTKAGLVLVQYLYTRTCATSAAVAAASDAEASRKLFQVSLETYAAAIDLKA